MGGIPLLKGYAQRLTTSRLGHTIMMVALIPLYALCFVAIKAALPFAPPLRFAAVRLLLASIGLFAVVLLRGQSLGLPRRLWPWVLVLAVSAGTLGYGTMFLSPGRAGAGIASVLGNAQPLLIAGFAVTLFHERITKGKVLALVLGIVGIFLISATSLQTRDLASLFGALLALLSSGSFVLASFVIKRLDTRDHLLTLTAWQLLLGSLPLFVLSALFERSSSIVWQAAFIGVLVFLALLGTALTTSVWYWLIQHDDLSRLSVYLFLVPVVGVGFAVLLLGEAIGLLEGLGMLAIIGGIGATLWEEASQPPAATN